MQTPRNGSARFTDGPGILLPDGTEARQHDPLVQAQTMAVEFAHGLAQAPVNLTACMQVIDEHLAKHPEAGLDPGAQALLAVLRMVARWQFEAQTTLRREAERQGRAKANDAGAAPPVQPDRDGE